MGFKVWGPGFRAQGLGLRATHPRETYEVILVFYRIGWWLPFTAG